MRATRREIVAALAAGGLAAARASRPAVAAAAPAATRSFRILMILERDAEGPVEAAFREYLAEHGVAAEIAVRVGGGDRRRLAGLVAEARDLRPDLVYTYGTDVTLAVVGRYDKVDPRRHIVDIPVVYTMVSSPKAMRIVAARRTSGRNVTGVDHTVPVSAQLRAIRAYRPMGRLGVIYDAADEDALHNVGQLRDLARTEDFELVEARVPAGPDGEADAESLPGLVADLARREPQFLYLGSGALLRAHADAATEAAALNRLATFTASEAVVGRSGALIGLVNRERNVGRYTALKAVRILVDGVPPADIPNDAMARPSYLVNLATARRLDLYPPMTVVAYAEMVGA